MQYFIAAFTAAALVASASADFVTVKNKDPEAHSLRIKSATGGNNDQKISAKATRDYTCKPTCTLILRDSDTEIEAAADQTIVIEGGSFSVE
jgi:hypothetical protein